MRSIERKFYKSAAWLKCRAGYIKYCGGLCERCLSKGIVAPGYIVHHKIYLTPDNVNDPSISLNYDNLEYLCHDCHNAEHFKEKTNRRYKISPDGNVIVS